MFEWRSSAPNPIVVNSGPLAGRTFSGPMAGFGESLVTTGPITGEVVYVGRGCDPAYPIGSATPIPFDTYLANPAGKIALIDRGTCAFVGKVKKAEDLGALMVIVANNIAGPATAMGGADPSITIPSVMVTLEDGNTLRPSVGNVVTISDGTGGVPDRDSDLDNGVIAARVRPRHLEPPHRRPERDRVPQLERPPRAHGRGLERLLRPRA